MVEVRDDRKELIIIGFFALATGETAYRCFRRFGIINAEVIAFTFLLLLFFVPFFYSVYKLRRRKNEMSGK